MNAVRSLGLISTREASEILGCTVQHVRLLLRKGELRGERVGRDWIIDEKTVRGLLSSRYDQNNRRPPKQIHEPQVESLFYGSEFQSVVNVASVPQRSPFRYPGGKTWLIPIARLWLQSVRPKLFIEPFAGGGGIGLMAAFEGFATRSLLVELDPDIAAVWQVMVNGQGPELAKIIRAFDLNSETVRVELAKEPENALDKAFLTIVRNRVSRGGILAPGAGLVKNGEAGKGIASRWYPETLARRIEAIHERRGSISFKEGDGMEALCHYRNEPNTACFIDPPYPVAGRRLYRYHELDHRELFQTMSLLNGSFLATYDHNPKIVELAGEFDFKTRLVPMKSTHHTKKFELLISRSFDWLPVGVAG